MANDYDALIAGETKQNLRASIAQTNGVAPDAEAEIRRLGRVYQLPTSTVRNNLPEVQKRATADSFDYDTLVARSPRTANYLAEPENAKIAHDDVDSLSGIEQFIQNLGGLAKASGLGLVEGVVGANQALNSVLDPLGWAVGPGSKSYAGADVYRKAARKRTEQFMPVTTNAWEAGVNAGVVSLFQQAPMMAAAVALRNPELALGGMGATVGGQSYGEAKDAGKSTGEALAFGVNQAAIEVLTERLPVGALVGDIAKGTGILQTLAKQLVLDVPGEQLATAFQDLNEWATLNPEKPFSEYLAERPNAALQTLVASVVGSGGMVTVGKIAGAAAGLDRKREQAQGATAQADALAQMEKLAAASKLRERDPQSFQDFIAAATEDGPVSDVYVSAEGLKQSGVDLEALAATVPAVASQLQDAIASGGDVRIPVDEFATFLAGDSMAKALLPHLATEAGGFSQTSAEEYMATQATALQSEVEGVLARSTNREAAQASAEKVQTYFLDQLNTAKRFTPDVNSAYATMMGSFYAVNAERLGITPEEMLARYPLQIRAEGVLGGAGALDQGPMTVGTAPQGLLMVAREHGGYIPTGALSPGERAALDEMGITVTDGEYDAAALVDEARRRYDANDGSWNNEQSAWDNSHVDALNARYAQKAPPAGALPQLSFDNEDTAAAYENLSDPAKAALKEWAEGRNMAPDRALNNPAILQEVYDAGQGVRDMLAPSADADGNVWLYRGERNGQEQHNGPLGSYTLSEAVAKRFADSGPNGGVVQRVPVPLIDVVGEGSVDEQEVIVRRPQALDQGAADLSKNGEIKLGDTTVMWTADADGAEIISVRTPTSKRGQGSARAALESVLAEADARGLPVKLGASPLDKRTRLGPLVEFYRSLGFEPTGRTINAAGEPEMIREPQALNQEGDQLFHGSRTVGLDELQPGERGALGPGVYLTPNENVAKRYGDAVYGALEPAGIFQGIKSRDSSVNPYQVWRDQAERLVDANPEHADGIRDLMASLQPDDGYPLFKRLAQLVGSEQGAQDLFRNAGFTGISGTADGPEVVVFDPVTVDVLNQKARGQFSPATSTITLLKNADLSTFLHESGHFYLETLADMASQPDAPAEIAADMEAVLKWFGTMNAPKASGSGPLNQSAQDRVALLLGEFTKRAQRERNSSKYVREAIQRETEQAENFAKRAQDYRDRPPVAATYNADELQQRSDTHAMQADVWRQVEKNLKPTKPTPIGQTEPTDGSAPDVDWFGRDLQDTGTVSATSVVRDYGNGKGVAYRAYIPAEQFPDESLAEEQDGEDPEGYDWSELRSRGTPPPAKVVIKPNGDMYVSDGNHRTRFWREAGFAYLPAWVIDQRKGATAERPAEALAQNGAQGAPGEGPMTLERWRAMTLDEQRYYHEAFARGFEAYLFEGKAPSNALRGVFQRFAAWMRNIYREITRLKVDLTDDVRGVFDRMLASAAQIEEQAQADSVVPMFQTAEDAGMTEEAFADYKAQATAAMAEGMDQLQTRSLRDMKWLSGAKDKVIRRLQREAADARKAIRAEVTEEVMAEPINRARQFLKRGIGADGQPVEGPHKLSLPALRLAHEGVPEELQDYKRLGYGRYGMLAEEGLDPDLVAESFGLPSGEALVEALLNAEPAADKIAGMTDQRMLERYGDLTDDDAIERAADQALHNSARLKFVATEANALATAAGRPRILARAAKDYALAMVGRLRVKDVKPYRYRAAETRAAQAAEKARKAGDLVTATVEKRNQLINAHATRAAYDTQAEIDKALNAWRRIVTGNDEAMARNRDMDLVNAARAVLAVYGVGRKKNDVQGYIDTLKRLNPSLYADIEPFLTRAAVNGAPWQDITVEEFMGLRDTVAQLWFLSRRNRQMEVDGQLVDRKAVAAELSAKLDERGVPDVRPGETEDVTDGQRVLRALSGFRAAARRVESWVRKIDAADTGPFRKYLWQPISETADAYLLAQRDYLQRFLALTQALGPIKAVKIAAPEIGYTFADKGRLLHAILHTGNESNKRKLLLGRGWASETAEGMLDTQRWDAMVARMVAEGKLTKADYDFAQGVWDLLDETKEGAQRAHRAVYGRYFEEVTADRFETPFGSYRGGYVPALTDQFLVQDAALRAQQDALTEGDAQMFPSPAKGFTKSRVDYNKQLALDLRLLPQHIDKVLKFTYFAAPSQDAVRLLKEKGLSAKLEAYDPVAQTDLLLPWLNRAAKQIVETPMPMGAAGKAAGTFFRAVRQRTGMGIMFANLSNSLQQLTGFSVAAVRVKPSLLASALVQYVQNPKEMTEAIRAVSPFMVGRGDSQVFEMRQTIDDLLLDPTTFKTAQQFAARHGYFMQTAFQNLVDNVTWKGAHEQAIAQGETETQAVRFANSVVRETQGGMRPEDIARFETGNAFVRLFTQFAGFFNMMANLQGTEFSITAQTMGLRKGAGRMFYVYAMGFAVPAVLSEIIVQSMKGSLGDDDGDGYLDDFLDMFFGSQVRFGLAMVPVAGQVAATGLNFFNDKRYDDRLSTPTISAVESAVKAPNSIYKAIAEDGDKSTALKDTLSLMTLLTGIPFTILGRPGGYMVDVAEGDVAPAGPVDAVRGLVTGAASPQSRE